LIVGQQVTQAANDKQQLAPLVEKIEEQSGQKPPEVIADSGYCSEENLKYLKKRKIERSQDSWRRESKSKTKGANLANQGRYRSELAESSRWNGGYRPRLVQRFMRHENSS